MIRNPSSDSQQLFRSLQAKLSEYEEIIGFCGTNSGSEVNYERLEAYLIDDCEWTEEAAIELTRLVQRYGSFMLMNAFALAAVCDVEDGDLGF
jgi:hypothetical protein